MVPTHAVVTLAAQMDEKLPSRQLLQATLCYHTNMQLASQMLSNLQLTSQVPSKWLVGEKSVSPSGKSVMPSPKNACFLNPNLMAGELGAETAPQLLALTPTW